jgi:hypothetical protein
MTTGIVAEFDTRQCLTAQHEAAGSMTPRLRAMTR